MNKQLSDQELGQMVQKITEQYASPPSINSNLTKKRIWIGLGILSFFISLTLMFMHQMSSSLSRSKTTYPPVQVASFEDPPTSEIVQQPPTPPTIPTVDPVQIPIPPLPISSQTSQMLPLPIPDNQTEIRPLIPPTPLPPLVSPILETPIKPQDNPPSDHKKDTSDPVTSTPEKESDSVIEIQISPSNDN